MNDLFLPGNINFNSLNKHIPVNQNGYRTIEFDSVDWENSIVVFGCSMVFGTGLDENQTICYHLNKMLNRPVINMGVPASSIMYSVYNQLSLKEQHTPYAVVNLWTSLQRHTYFLDQKPINLGPWADSRDLGKHLKMFYSLWGLDNNNISTTAQFLKRISDIFWNDTIHIQASFFENTAELFHIELLPFVDHAADNEHPGPLTAYNTAKLLAEQF
jgi:hypothetical protein